MTPPMTHEQLQERADHLRLGLSLERSPDVKACLTNWLIREVTPDVLDLAGRAVIATGLRELPAVPAAAATRPGLMHKYVAPCRDAADAVERDHWAGYHGHRPAGPPSPVEPTVTAGANTARFSLPGRAGWWAYRAFHGGANVIADRYPSRLPALVDVIGRSYDDLCSRLIAVDSTEIFPWSPPTPKELNP